MSIEIGHMYEPIRRLDMWIRDVILSPRFLVLEIHPRHDVIDNTYMTCTALVGEKVRSLTFRIDGVKKII